MTAAEWRSLSVSQGQIRTPCSSPKPHFRVHTSHFFPTHNQPDFSPAEAAQIFDISINFSGICSILVFAQSAGAAPNCFSHFRRGFRPMLSSQGGIHHSFKIGTFSKLWYSFEKCQFWNYTHRGIRGAVKSRKQRSKGRI